MRKFLITAAALTALAVPAVAADMPVKAAPTVPFITANGSGWYWGVGTYAGVAQSSVNGNNLFLTGLVSSNLTADGAGVDVALGYIHGNTNILGIGNWYRGEAECSYQNISGGVQVAGNSASVSSHWACTQEADIGADVLAQIMAILPNLSVSFPTFTPSLPANVAVAAIPKQYIGLVVREHQLDGQFGVAHGTTWAVAPGIKSGFLFQTLGKDGRPNGGAVDLWASVTWDTKGATLNNVFGAGGPITVGPGARMGTTYLTGIRADFGL